MLKLKNKRKVKRIVERGKVFEPLLPLYINPIAPSKPALKRVINHFLEEEDCEELVRINDFKVRYFPNQKKLTVTLRGIFKFYSLLQQDFVEKEKTKTFTLELE
jgi:hypothetical protein